jgi:hypothetical protein
MAVKKPTPNTPTTPPTETAKTLDRAKYVRLLIEGGTVKADADRIVNNVCDNIQKLMPRDSLESWDTLIMIKIREYLRVGEADEFKGLCIAIDAPKDSMGYQKYLAREAYKKDPRRAIAEGMITKEGDKVVEMDTRKFLDKENTRANRNFGKKLPTIMRREAFFIIDKKLVRAFGDFEGEVGRVYTFYGFMNESGILNVNRSPTPKLLESMSDVALWKATYEVVADSEMAMDLVAIPEQQKGTYVITRGTIQHVTQTGQGSTMCFLADDELPKGVACFASCDSVAEEMNSMGRGSNVIVLGRVLKTKGPEGEDRTAINTMGLIQDPVTVGRSEILDKLDESMYK